MVISIGEKKCTSAQRKRMRNRAAKVTLHNTKRERKKGMGGNLVDEKSKEGETIRGGKK